MARVFVCCVRSTKKRGESPEFNVDNAQTELLTRQLRASLLGARSHSSPTNLLEEQSDDESARKFHYTQRRLPTHASARALNQRRAYITGRTGGIAQSNAVMFAAGSKKSKDTIARCFDVRRDVSSRIKHFKILFEEQLHTADERAQVIETRTFEIFHLLNALFWTIEPGQTMLKHTPELDFTLSTLEAVFRYCPHMTAKRIQHEAIKLILLKCIEARHLPVLRQRALRTFFIWYQVIGACEAVDEQMDMIFEATLPTTSMHASASRPESLTSTHASDTVQSEHSSSSDPRAQQQRINNLAHECHKFLNTMFCDTHLIHWPDEERDAKRRACIYFLFARMQKHFLCKLFKAHVFDERSWTVAELRKSESAVMERVRPELLVIRYAFIRWFIINVSEVSTSGNESATTEHTQQTMPCSTLVRSVIESDKHLTQLLLAILRYAMHCLQLKITPTVFTASLVGRTLRLMRQWTAVLNSSQRHETSTDDVREQMPEYVNADQLVHIACCFFYNEYITNGSQSVDDKIFAIIRSVAERVLAFVKNLCHISTVSNINWRLTLDHILAVVTHTLPVENTQATVPQHWSDALAGPMLSTLLVSWVAVTGMRGVRLPAPMWDALVLDVLRPRAYYAVFDQELAKILSSVTRVLSMCAYNIDPLNLPLEQLSEQKTIKPGGKQVDATITHEALKVDDKEPSTLLTLIGEMQSLMSPMLLTSSRKEDLYDFTSPMLPLAQSNDLQHDSLPSTDMTQHSTTSSQGSQTRKPSSGALLPPTFSTTVDSAVGADYTSMTGSSSVITVASDSEVPPDVGTHASSPMHEGSRSDVISVSSLNIGRSHLHERHEDETILNDDDDSASVSASTTNVVDLTPRDVAKQSAQVAADEAARWLLIWRRLVATCTSAQTISATLDSLLQVRANQSHDALTVPPVLWLLRRLMQLLDESVVDDYERQVAIDCATRVLLSPLDTLAPPTLLAKVCAAIITQLRGTHASMMLKTLTPHLFEQRIPHLLTTLLPHCLSACELQSNITDDPSFALYRAQFCACCAALRVPSKHAAQYRRRAIIILMRSCEKNSPPIVQSLSTSALCVYLHHVYTHQYRDEDDLKEKVLHALLDASRHYAPTLATLSWLLHATRTCVDTADMHAAIVCALTRAVMERHHHAPSLITRLLYQLTEWLLSSPYEQHSPLRHQIVDVLLTVARDTRNAAADRLETACVVARSCLTLLLQCAGQYPTPGFSVVSLNSALDIADTPSNAFVYQRNTDLRLISSASSQQHSHMLIVRDIFGRRAWSIQRRDSLQPVVPKRTHPTNVSSTRQLLTMTSTERDSGVLPECLQKLQEERECTPLALHRTRRRDTYERLVDTSLDRLSLKVHERRVQSVSCNDVTTRNDSNIIHALLNDLSLLPSPASDTTNWSLLVDNDRLQRHLKHIDNLPARDQHKIAVVYVRNAQEDKESILANRSGSREFETFVDALGWNVQLETHCGYAGGLPPRGTTNYYADSTCEIVWHVSTRLAWDDNDAQVRVSLHHCHNISTFQAAQKRLRHLGNDYVCVVWSEHWRPYHRSTIATDFADALICIYPIRSCSGDYFVTVALKEALQADGPLFNGARVSAEALPALVRGTCLCASRAILRRISGEHAAPSKERNDNMYRVTSDTAGNGTTYSDLQQAFMQMH